MRVKLIAVALVAVLVLAGCAGPGTGGANNTTAVGNTTEAPTTTTTTAAVNASSDVSPGAAGSLSPDLAGAPV